MTKVRSLFERLYARVGGNAIADLRRMQEPLYSVTLIEQVDVTGGVPPKPEDREKWEACLREALEAYALPYIDEAGETRFRKACPEEFELKLATPFVAAFRHLRPDGQGNFVYVSRNAHLFLRIGGPYHRGEYPEALETVQEARA
jgi:hypothetical protein